VIVLDLSQYLA